MIAITAVLQVGIPLLLLTLIAFQRKPSVGQWALNLLAFGMVLSFMWGSARWDLSSIHMRTLLPILFVAAGVVGYRRIQKPEQKPPRIGIIIGITIHVALIVLMSGFNWFTFVGYGTPQNAVDLRSPLQDGDMVVLHGGASPFLNAHFRLRGQGYALDFLGLTGVGRSARLFGDRGDLASYPIFGAQVHSPCNGVVSNALDGFEDLSPPATDAENPAGNHVLIECHGVEVLLAHLRSGSVLVSRGDTVTTESVVGSVGNTGNTSEPHLHIHAEEGGEPGVALDGRSVPITINGRFLVRGNRWRGDA